MFLYKINLNTVFRRETPPPPQKSSSMPNEVYDEIDPSQVGQQNDDGYEVNLAMESVKKEDPYEGEDYEDVKIKRESDLYQGLNTKDMEIEHDYQGLSKSEKKTEYDYQGLNKEKIDEEHEYQGLKPENSAPYVNINL